jgi:hypothetical protein
MKTSRLPRKAPRCVCCGGTKETYRCRCACGREAVVCEACLLTGRSTSCGFCEGPQGQDAQGTDA